MLTLIILFAGLFVGLIGAGLVGLAVESYAEKQSRKEKIKAAILRLKERRDNMTREEFRKTGWKMSYEDFLKCDCTQCEKENCIHRGAYRRVPKIDGGLGLCPKLKGESK